MNLQSFVLLAGAVVLAAPLTSHANLSPYSQTFESLAPAEPGDGNNTALSDDGWLVFGNVFTAEGAYLYGYGAFAAPNGSLAFSGIAGGASARGGPAQGNQQLVVYSDYNNQDHLAGRLVESNVYRLQTIGAADVGTSWVFQFDAMRGDLAAPSTARAFIETRDPDMGFQLTGQNSIDMTAAPLTWATYRIPFTITAGAGQLFQFGFANTATDYALTGVFYDNISLAPVPEPSAYALMLAGLGLLGAAVRRRMR